MTGAELSRRLNVDRATIWRWEAGKQSPENADLIKAFADLFALDVDDALKAAGLRPTTEIRPAVSTPTDPDVLKLMRLLADPDTPEDIKEQVRAMLKVLNAMAEVRTPKQPRNRARKDA